MALIDGVQEDIVAVIDGHETMRLVGYVRQSDVVHAYDLALLRARDEAHGEV